MSMSKFTTINAFFVNMNKSSVPAIVPEQSKSASFVTLVEIHNVDVPVASNRDAGTLQWPNAIVVDFETESDSDSDSHTQSACRPYYRHSSFPVAERKLKWQANYERLSCAQSSKFILFFVQ